MHPASSRVASLHPGAALVLAALFGACGPMGPIPGGALHGERVREPVRDWSFADGHTTIELETSIHAHPHSVTVWCFTHDGRLYVPSRHPRNKTWVRNVLADPRVLIKIGDKLYPARATRVTDSAELDSAVPALFAKYHLDPPAPGEDADAWIFHLAWRPPEAAS